MEKGKCEIICKDCCGACKDICISECEKGEKHDKSEDICVGCCENCKDKCMKNCEEQCKKC